MELWIIYDSGMPWLVKFSYGIYASFISINYSVLSSKTIVVVTKILIQSPLFLYHVNAGC